MKFLLFLSHSFVVTSHSTTLYMKKNSHSHHTMQREKTCFLYIFVASLRYNHFQYLQISPFHHRQQQQQLSGGSSSNVPASKEELSEMKQNRSQWSVFFCIIQQIENRSLNGEIKRKNELVRELGQEIFFKLKRFKIISMLIVITFKFIPVDLTNSALNPSLKRDKQKIF